MKRVFLVASICLAAVVFMLTGCTGPDGSVYLSFDWAYAPDSFSTNDTSLPHTIVRATDYKDTAGSWWFKSWYYWYTYNYVDYYYTYLLNYTLTVNKGGLFNQAGKDAKFKIYCPWDDYPTIAQTQNQKGEARSAANSITFKQGDPGSEGTKVGEYTQIDGGYKLHVEIYTGIESQPSK